jgi:hypothetical protein
MARDGIQTRTVDERVMKLVMTESNQQLAPTKLAALRQGGSDASIRTWAQGKRQNQAAKRPDPLSGELNVCNDNAYEALWNFPALAVGHWPTGARGSENSEALFVSAGRFRSGRSGPYVFGGARLGL